jgi:uncharacterized protein (DUF433 family)
MGDSYSVDQLLRSWPELSQPAIEEAITLASQTLQARYAAPREAAMVLAGVRQDIVK